MAVQWNSSFERLKPNATRLKSWVADTRRQVSGTLEQWPVFSHLKGFDQQDWNLARIQQRIAGLQDMTRSRIGNEVYAKSIALGRQLIKAQAHEVEISDGKISYWKTNNNSSETILFIHGFGDSKDGCYPLAMNLTRHYNMMAFDLPGFGSSFSAGDLAYNFETYGAWIVEFLEKIGSGPVHVIGNSLGGAMAMKLAELRPDLVKTLTLIDTAAIIDTRYDSAYDDFIKGKVIFQIKNREEFDNFWKTLFHRPPLLPIFLKDCIYDQFRSNYDLYGRFILETFDGISSRHDPKLDNLFMDKALMNMKMPVHIMWGEFDKLFPLTYGQRAHEITPNSKFTVMKGVGHAPQVEAPHLTAKHIRRFIESQLKTSAKASAKA
ncbi:MAG: alpha/beta hydrolase [Proteobacteria bacterium]|nr:MAG: alpha/beta hydrolase [Pseudomonadota bacterium]